LLVCDLPLRYFDRVRIAQRFQSLQSLQPWILVSAAWIVPAGFAVLNRIAQTHLRGWDPITLPDLLWEGGDWLLYGLLTPAVFVLSKRLPLTRTRLGRHVFLHFVLSLLFCIAWATSGKLLQLGLGLWFDPQAVRTALQSGTAQLFRVVGVDWLSWIFTTLPFGVAVYLCVVGIEHAIRYFIEAREREVQLARLSEQLSSARFAALQAQVNPHFLFNTLNTITVLVRDNERQAAVRIVEQLSDVLRTTLSSHRANEVPLGEDLDLVRQYVAIEEARFSDRLRPEFNIDAALLSALIPSFALQQLVENAIRHGIAKHPEAGRLLIAAQRTNEMLELTVSDDGVGIDAEFVMLPGHGLENTRERLRALYGEQASLELSRRTEGGAIATLRLPYREMAVEANHDAS
jgi:two-component system LytT family sensor kinase